MGSTPAPRTTSPAKYLLHSSTRSRAIEHASPLRGETLYVCGTLTGGLRPRLMSVVLSGLGAHPDGVDETFWIACVSGALEIQPTQ